MTQKQKQDVATKGTTPEVSPEQEALALVEAIKAKAQTLKGMGLVVGGPGRAATREYVNSSGRKSKAIELLSGDMDVRVGKSGMTWEGAYAISLLVAWASTHPEDGMEFAHKVQRAFVQHMGAGNGSSVSGSRSFL